MKQVMNADEIFDVAINIERKGKEFYEKLAQQVDNPKSKEIFIYLAEQEKEHESFFRQLKEKILGKKEFNTLYDYWEDQEKQEYLSYIAKSEIFPYMEKESVVTSLDNIKKILAYAIIVEKETILFYREILDAIHEKAPQMMEEKASLLALINEERKHVIQLNEMIRQL